MFLIFGFVFSENLRKVTPVHVITHDHLEISVMRKSSKRDEYTKMLKKVIKTCELLLGLIFAKDRINFRDD